MMSGKAAIRVVGLASTLLGLAIFPLMVLAHQEAPRIYEYPRNELIVNLLGLSGMDIWKFLPFAIFAFIMPMLGGVGLALTALFRRQRGEQPLLRRRDWVGGAFYCSIGGAVLVTIGVVEIYLGTEVSSRYIGVYPVVYHIYLHDPQMFGLGITLFATAAAALLWGVIRPAVTGL